ncbi:hypothetical protein B0G71_3278 [Paraburkholderia sp. BL27I4N3]|nr:hypothetical protein B0G71_3278 [Paraburkholderia sp. BL27I4N3]RKR42947.1 hypothetical protein B0G82_0494 [Paraburkholderia sp. BL17N1]
METMERAHAAIPARFAVAHAAAANPDQTEAASHLAGVFLNFRLVRKSTA